MKKFILFLLFFMFLFNVNASSKVGNEILLEEVKLEVSTKISYKEVLEVNYELLPRDVDNKKLDWRIVNKNTSLAVKLSDISTNLQKGIFVLDIENKSDKSLSFKLEVLQNKKVLSFIDIVVESKEETEDRLFLEDLEELKKLIKRLDVSINKNNKDENKYLLEEIDLVSSDLKSELSEEELEKVELVYKNIDEYNLKVENNKKIVIIILLSIGFFIVLTLMFRKEKK